MLYQKILTDGRPYELILSEFGVFSEHRHADIEFNYCIKGSFDIIINKKKYHVNEGELSLISPMTSHEVPDCNDEECLVLTTIVGATFLREHFGAFTKSVFSTNTNWLNWIIFHLEKRKNWWYYIATKRWYQCTGKHQASIKK